MRAAEEIGQAERNITHRSYDIEEVITHLSHSQDESLQIVASKLRKTLSELRRETRSVKMTQVALEKIAETYAQTEEDIRAYEDRMTMQPISRVLSQDILDGYKAYAGKTFSEL